jgi:hypothetical protein
MKRDLEYPDLAWIEEDGRMVPIEPGPEPAPRGYGGPAWGRPIDRVVNDLLLGMFIAFGWLIDVVLWVARRFER